MLSSHPFVHMVFQFLKLLTHRQFVNGHKQVAESPVLELLPLGSSKLIGVTI